MTVRSPSEKLLLLQRVLSKPCIGEKELSVARATLQAVTRGSVGFAMAGIEVSKALPDMVPEDRGVLAGIVSALAFEWSLDRA